MLASFYLYSFW